VPAESGCERSQSYPIWECSEQADSKLVLWANAEAAIAHDVCFLKSITACYKLMEI
jgi:hypothetical protein